MIRRVVFSWTADGHGDADGGFRVIGSRWIDPRVIWDCKEKRKLRLGRQVMLHDSSGEGLPQAVCGDETEPTDITGTC